MENLLKNATEILLLLFLIITFLQSGIDKVYDWQGNLGWLKGHFAETPLKGLVPLLLGIVMLVEIISGVLCLIGIYQLLILGDVTMAFYGAILSCLALLMLLFGQRMAKDYEGAKTIAVYFVPAIFLVFLLQV
tara:strand:- start:62 stop:460 length:399 start_codon:yes stop_codon:yes gene_type:complete